MTYCGITIISMSNTQDFKKEVPITLYYKPGKTITPIVLLKHISQVSNKISLQMSPNGLIQLENYSKQTNSKSITIIPSLLLN